MISQNILELAKELIGKDRQDDYGDKLTNNKNIAAVGYMVIRKKKTTKDVAMSMAVDKVSRVMDEEKYVMLVEI